MGKAPLERGKSFTRDLQALRLCTSWAQVGNRSPASLPDDWGSGCARGLVLQEPDGFGTRGISSEVNQGLQGVNKPFWKLVLTRQATGSRPMPRSKNGVAMLRHGLGFAPPKPDIACSSRLLGRRVDAWHDCFLSASASMNICMIESDISIEPRRLC